MLLFIEKLGVYYEEYGIPRIVGRMLRLMLVRTMGTEPMRIGVIRNDQPLPASMTTIGSAPAGGCVVFVNIIAAMAVPTANPTTHTPLPKVFTYGDSYDLEKLHRTLASHLVRDQAFAPQKHILVTPGIQQVL